MSNIMVKTLKVIETFKSLQGEGIQAGLPTFFIRLAGCNLRCSYCDTKYAYGRGQEKSIKELVLEAKRQGLKLVCLTGGEPLDQPEAKDLVLALLKAGFQIDIETNGSKSLRKFPNSPRILFSWDVKCPSSGMSRAMDLSNLLKLKQKDQVKFIIDNREDYDFSKKIIKKYRLLGRTNIIMTPVGGVKAAKLAAWIIKDNLPVRIGLQIHKVIWRSERKQIAAQKR